MISLPLILSYAEIHYHLKNLFPKYYKNEPEIIADVPLRYIIESLPGLPVLLIIKDSAMFPIILEKLEIKIVAEKRKENFTFSIQRKIAEKYFSKIFYLPIKKFHTEQNLQIQVLIHFQQNKQKKTILNDNYPDINLSYFNVFITKNKLPVPDNFFAGDPHYHSIHTSDQVEFGADIAATKIMAKSLGLDWFFVTDHSYDLDDEEKDFTKNDPQLPIWKKMQKKCKINNEADLRIVAGEEVSIGNSKNQNVHLLAINHQDFIAGSGDSAENWFANKPEHLLSEIRNLHDRENLFIAAHPAEKVPLLQKLLLRRGQWTDRDIKAAGIEFLQIINSDYQVEKLIEYWKELLLAGNKYFILAGNDAHGNFNVMRQIKIPFYKLFASQKQIFGKFFTIVKGKRNDPVQNIKNGTIIVSNGPFVDFYLVADQAKFSIGSTLNRKDARVYFDCKTTVEFGEIEKVELLIGDIFQKKEKTSTNLRQGMGLKLPAKGYLRMMLRTRKNGIAFTNPIWIN